MQWPSSVSALEKETNLFAPHARSHEGNLAVMLTGGGARASYQVGLLKGIARHFPNLRFQIITGVSAGAINAVFLASKPGSLYEKANALEQVWCELTCNSIYYFDWRIMLPFRSVIGSLFPRKKWSIPRGMVDTAPLRELLYRIFESAPHQAIRGIEENLSEGWLHAVALITMDYTTGQSVRWVQGQRLDTFDFPNRRNASASLTADHVLASAALPFVFPAVNIDGRWHGDGGIRLSAPLSPAVHLGASRIIAMSTGYQRTPDEVRIPVMEGYPSSAQIIGQLVSAIFLDAIDEDVWRMERLSEMVGKLDAQERDGFRPIDLLVMRPSVDLGKLAGEYEQRLPLNLRLLTRALGARKRESLDFISMLMFEPAYTKRLIEIGEADVESRLDELRLFLAAPEPRAAAV